MFVHVVLAKEREGVREGTNNAGEWERPKVTLRNVPSRVVTSYKIYGDKRDISAI
ncbi:MAG: hypothetical protein ACEY26_00670 [Candidatus Hodgkinia cicadicola]